MDNYEIKIINEKGNKCGSINKKEADRLVKLKAYEYLCNNEIGYVKKSNKLSKITIPKYTLSEELLSSISHGIGTLLSIAILVLCVIFSAIHNDPYAVVSSAIYGSSSIILYTMSTLYHSLKVNLAKRVFRIIDHCSIYLLIAGTYTPYALVSLRSVSPATGWTVFGIIWGCAAIGITFTAIDMNKFKVPGLILYLVMGWMIVISFKTLMSSIDMAGIYLMLGAGIIYTIGAILYGVGKKVKYMHSVFHFFVVAASVLFFFSIFLYVI